MATANITFSSNGLNFNLTLTFAGAATSGQAIAISGTVGSANVVGLTNYVQGDNIVNATDPYFNDNGLSFVTDGPADANDFNIYDTAGASTYLLYSENAGAPVNALVTNVTYTPASANTPPTLGANAGSTVAEGGSDTITNAELDFNDAQQDDAAITYTVTTAVTNGTLFNNGVAVGLNGTFTQADINANRITYTHNGGETTSASFGFSVSDGQGGTVTGQTFNFTVTPVNDPPAVQNAPPSVITVTEDVLADIELGNFNFGDPDSSSGSLTLTIAASAGTLFANSAGGVTVGNSGTGTITLSGTAVAINAFIGTGLNDVSYQTAANANGTNVATLTYSITDNGNTGAGGGGIVLLGTTQINATAVNDAPTATGVPSDISVTSGVASNVNLSAITFGDVDSGAGNVTFTIAASSGTLAGGSAGGVTVSGSATGTLTLTGTAANIDAYLNTASNIQYTSATGAAGNNAATLTLTANDNGNTGSGGGTTVALGTVNLDISEAPSLVVTTLSDVVDAFDGVTSLREAIAYANSNAGADTITFDASLNGTIRLDGGDGAGGTVGGTLNVSDALTIDGDGRITISGDVAGDDITRTSSTITDLAATKAAGNFGDNVRVISTSAALTVANLTVTGGNGGDATGDDGGAISGQSQTVTLTNAIVAGNAAVHRGGGVFAGTVLASDSIVDGNSSYRGGGLFAGYGAISGATISNNVGTENGGGLQIANLTITNSTLSGNSALRGGAAYSFDFDATNITVTGNSASAVGGGLHVASGSSFTNSIIAGNLAASDSEINAAFGFTLSGGNIVGANVFSGATDVGNTTLADVFASTALNVNSGVVGGVLANNGGPVQTVALNTAITNPAIDAANASAPTTDARGFASFDNPDVANTNGGSARDLGAFEAGETQSLIVTTLADVVDAFDGQTSLREAITFANSKTGADTITFDASLNGTIRLDGGDGAGGTVGGTLSITDALTIDGDGRITISGDVADDDVTVTGTDITNIAASTTANTLADNVRVLSAGNNPISLTLDGLTVTGGRTTGELGGGIFLRFGSLTLTDSTVSGNTSGAGGGGFFSASATISGSTISGNTTTGNAPGGGFETGSVTISNSTISGNSTVGQNAVGGGFIASNSITLTNTTVAGNSTAGQYARGGGIYSASASHDVELINSTVTGNVTTGANANAAGIDAIRDVILTNSIVLGNYAQQNVNGDVRSQNLILQGGNIVGTNVFSDSVDVGDTTASAVFAQTVDIGGGVLAGVLADNGGPVQTVALNPNPLNPARDASGPGAPITDARGADRQDALGVGNDGTDFADLGAYEHLNQAPRIFLQPSLDVAGAEPASDGVAIAFGDGTGVLFPGGGELTGTAPQDVILADFDGDGFLDIATSNSGDNTVTILLGDGCGCFNEAPGSPITVGLAPRGMDVGFINNDAILDLVVANRGDNTVTALIGNGDGTFTATSSVAYFNGTITDIALAEVSDDGVQDLIIVGNSTIADNIRIANGNGSGGFTLFSTEVLGIPTNLVDIETADFNGDGEDDLIAVSQSNNLIYVRTGTDTFGFNAPGDLATGAAPTDAAIGDVNGDTFLDIVVANNADDTVGVFLGNGDGTFGTQTTFTAGDGPAAVALADLDEDGDLDIVAGHDDGSFHVLLGAGDGTFAPDQNPLFSNFPVTALAVGNIDADVEDTYPLFVNYTEGETKTLAPRLVLTDDSAAIGTAVLVILGGVTGDVLAADTTGTNITATYDAANFTLELTGSDTVANYQQVLRTITFTSGEDPTDELNGGGAFGRVIALSIADDEGVNSEVAQSGIFVVVNGVDDAPVAALDTSTVNEFAANGTVVGTLSATDVDTAGGTFTFSLVTGQDAGGRFRIVGDQLRVADGLLLDYEQSATHTVRVLIDDGLGGTFEQDLTITINDINPELVRGDGRGNTFVGGALADYLIGNAGGDVLAGGDGNDNLYGGLGADTLSGGAGYDYARYDDTNYGNLVIYLGNAYLNQGAAAAGDSYAGIEGVVGGAGDDTITGDGNANRLVGLGGHDLLSGGVGDDTLEGGAGNDRLAGGDGIDTLRGGVGDDIYYWGAGDTIIEVAGEGTDTVVSAGTVYAGLAIENLQLTGADNVNAIGNGLDNRVAGNAGNNILIGGDGQDTLIGGDGNDFLQGGRGYDDMIGGAGADRFDFNDVKDSDVGVLRDLVRNFNGAEGDRIDLISIDANTLVANDQAFSFISAADFSGTAGQLRFFGGILSGDVDGNAFADFEIRITGQTTLTTADILL